METPLSAIAKGVEEQVLHKVMAEHLLLVSNARTAVAQGPSVTVLIVVAPALYELEAAIVTKLLRKTLTARNATDSDLARYHESVVGGASRLLSIFPLPEARTVGATVA